MTYWTWWKARGESPLPYERKKYKGTQGGGERLGLSKEPSFSSLDLDSTLEKRIPTSVDGQWEYSVLINLFGGLRSTLELNSKTCKAVDGLSFWVKAEIVELALQLWKFFGIPSFSKYSLATCTSNTTVTRTDSSRALSLHTGSNSCSSGYLWHVLLFYCSFFWLDCMYMPKWPCVFLSPVYKLKLEWGKKPIT